MIRYEQMGLVAELSGKSSYRFLPIARFAAWVSPAIAHRQIKFAFDESGNPIAYWTWAWLAPDVSKRMTGDPRALLHESEWNEGSELWIMDFIVLSGHLMDVIRYIQEVQFPGLSQAFSVRRHRDGTLKKKSTWRPSSSRSRTTSDNYLMYRLPNSAFADSRTSWLMVNRAI